LTDGSTTLAGIEIPSSDPLFLTIVVGGHIPGPRQSSSALGVVATRKRLCLPVRMLVRQGNRN
jgi:hypothetical protein